jgi:hypothetical protein
MNWQFDKPTTPGWYVVPWFWLNPDTGKRKWVPQLLILEDETWLDSASLPIDIKTYAGPWCGPLPEPPEKVE